MDCDSVRSISLTLGEAAPPVPPTTPARSACVIERKLKNPEPVRGSGFYRFAPL